tara:strand:+ start:642 stop:1661 length:1020 start_codon:yes stop_codon:yes gene_type:complete
MAIHVDAFSPKQFMFLVAEQDDFGTVEPAGGQNYLHLDVDSVGTPSFNINQVIEPRTGSRVLQATDFFQDKLAKVIEISVSGTANIETLDKLLTHITGDTSSPYAVASNIEGQSFTSATADQTDIQILSCVYRSPLSGTDLSFKDCFCTSLSISGDMGTEGGRLKFSATFKTGSVPADLSDGQTSIDTAISADATHVMSMNPWSAANRKVAGIANVLCNSFTFNIENDCVFSGPTSTGYESVARVGEFSATADFNIKYDTNTEVLFANFHDQTGGATEGITQMGAGDDTPSDGEFEFQMASSIITNVGYAEGDIMGLDVSVKAVGAGRTSGTALFQISC